MKTSNSPVPDETTQYAEDVVSLKIPACRYVVLACQRHLSDLRRKDVWFDPHAGRKFFRFSERHLKHYKGPMRGQTLKLNPWQKFIFGCIYGWKRIDEDGEKTDLWRFNIIYLEVPRKNGKTTMCAAGAAYDCIAIEETGAEVYVLATKEDQAKIMHNDIAAFIAKSDQLAGVFEILKGKNTIFNADSDRTSFIKPLGADSQRLDGLNPLSAYCDELHQWPKEDLWNVMEEAFGARDNWHMVAITTAGDNREGVCYKKRDALINILEGRTVNDNMFGIIYTVDEGQEENWTEEKTWLIANPNLGMGKQLQYMRDRSNAAQNQPSSVNPFKNKQLNIWTDVAEAWLSYRLWISRSSKFDFESLKYCHCTGAFDLARVADLSAVAYGFPKQGHLTKNHFLVDFYLPQGRMKENSERDHIDYELWERDKWLTVTPGKTTDYNFIRRDISERAKIVRLDKIMYDRHFSGELVQNLTNDGFTLEEMGMGFLSLGPPTAELERQLVEDECTHNNNPILNWNASNTVIRRDAMNNIKPDKDLSGKKIDGIVSVIMTLFDIIKNIPSTSKYETGDMVVVGGGKRR